jgi:hypothetical protein
LVVVGVDVVVAVGGGGVVLQGCECIKKMKEISDC